MSADSISALIRKGGNRFFARDKREAFARRSCSNKKTRPESGSTQLNQTPGPAANSRAHMPWVGERRGTRLSCRSGAALQLLMQNWRKADGSAPGRWLSHDLVGNLGQQERGLRSSLPTYGSRECVPDDRLSEAIQSAGSNGNWIASSQRSSQ